MLVFVKDQAGRHAIDATADIYGRLVPRADKAAVDRVDDTTGRNRFPNNQDPAREVTR